MSDTASKKRIEFDSFAEVEARAKRRLPPTLFHDLMFGISRGITAQSNVDAYDRITFRTRAAVGWKERDLTTTVLGTEISLPVILAPVGGLRMVNPQGAPGAAAAAAEAGTICAVSMVAGHTPAQIAAASNGPYWQQLYLSRGRERAEKLMADARANGAKALVLTVDTPVSPKKPVHLRISVQSALQFGPELIRRPRWLKGFLRDGAQLAVANDAIGPRLNQTALWEDLNWIKEEWNGPLVVKGIMNADDARRAVDHGADAIVVSNHGGLTIDGAPATISVLPEVVAAVGGTAEVLVDGGVRQGTDVIKAVAMGARAVLIGRPYAAGLAADGEAGVLAVLNMFRGQIDKGLAMMGCPSVRALDESFLRLPPEWLTSAKSE